LAFGKQVTLMVRPDAMGVIFFVAVIGEVKLY